MKRLSVLLCLALAACGTPHGLGARTARTALPTAAPATTGNEETLYLTVVDGLLKQQRYGAALAFLDDYGRRPAAIPARYWLLRGNALLGLDRSPEAATAFAKLDATSLAADGWNGKGRAAASRKQWRIAAANFRQAVEASPSNAEFLNNMAYSSLRLGQPRQAIPYLRQARELDPGSSLIRNNLIIALSLSGDQAGADQLMRTINDPRRRQDVVTMIAMAQTAPEN